MVMETTGGGAAAPAMQERIAINQVIAVWMGWEGADFRPKAGLGLTVRRPRRSCGGAWPQPACLGA